MSSVAAPVRPLTVAFLGNPNTGKSTLFGALSGYRVQTGNYPGVTVEKTIGRTKFGDRAVNLVDLPGTYSLSPRTLDEMVAVNVLLGRVADVGTPDVVVCIVDASNIERNLYLFSQVLDIGLPTVLVLNMADVAKSRGVEINAAKLSEKLGVPVVLTQAHRKQGLDEVRKAVLKAAEAGAPPRLEVFPPAFMAECEALEKTLDGLGRPEMPLYLRERALLDVGGYIESHLVDGNSAALAEHVQAARERLAAQGCKVPSVEARVRYAWVRDVLTGAVERPTSRPVTFSDKLDALLTHRFAGFFVFAALMFLIFQAISTGAGYPMEYFELAQGFVADQITAVVPPGPLRSLLNEGVVAGVGGVLVFLPQIVILFLFIALLEDCGYMARAAFLMDRLMTRVGLSGKSFVPLMSSFACAIPGVMATRVIENRRDRMTTILVAPLMSCSARQPVYLLMIAAFVPATMLFGWLNLQGIVLFAMTFLGAAVAVPIAWILKKTFFKGETPPFVMELPSYKWPSLRLVLNRVYVQAKAFVVRAGTLIFATSVLIWAAGYFPGDHTEQDRLQAAIEAEQARIAPQDEILTARIDEALQTRQWNPSPRALQLQQDQLRSTLNTLTARRNVISERLLEQSFLGRLGHVIEPAVRPLGWDWKIGVGVIASFPAREVIVATLGTIYSLGEDVDEESDDLRSAIQAARWPNGKPVYNLAVALSIMVFFALCAQCAATLMVIRRETGSWIWPLFTFTYMTALAYVAAFVTYQIASRF